MNQHAKPIAVASVDGITTAALLETLAAHPEKPLIFNYDGHDVKPSYHVTEVKNGNFRALDCGANPESWQETFIQLWDIVEENRGHMPAGKFVAIIRKVTEAVGLAPDAKLTFEVSDGVKPMQLFKADGISFDGPAIRVPLSPRASSCKPRDRWLTEQEAARCETASAKPCCG